MEILNQNALQGRKRNSFNSPLVLSQGSKKKKKGGGVEELLFWVAQNKTKMENSSNKRQWESHLKLRDPQRVVRPGCYSSVNLSQHRTSKCHFYRGHLNISVAVPLSRHLVRALLSFVLTCYETTGNEIKAVCQLQWAPRNINM